jgi:hypothetical protein
MSRNGLRRLLVPIDIAGGCQSVADSTRPREFELRVRLSRSRITLQDCSRAELISSTATISRPTFVLLPQPTPSLHSDTTTAALRNIQHHIELAGQFTAGFDYDTFCDDPPTVYAVTRCLEIISAASRRLPDELKGPAPRGRPAKSVAFRPSPSRFAGPSLPPLAGGLG